MAIMQTYIINSVSG